MYNSCKQERKAKFPPRHIHWNVSPATEGTTRGEEQARGPKQKLLCSLGNCNVAQAATIKSDTANGGTMERLPVAPPPDQGVYEK